MTPIDQARARWGERGIVHVQTTVDTEGHVETLYLVGRRGHDAHAWAVIGWGSSWKAAFRLADLHEGQVRR